MPDPKWHLLVEMPIPAKPEKGIWTLALDSVEGVARLRIEAEGDWTYDQNLTKSCGPDGDTRQDYDSSHCLMPKAPPGSLIGKLGGSTAGVEDGYVFVIGSFCVVVPGTPERGGTEKIPVNGPLYLGINDRRDGMSDNTGKITVRVLDPKLASPST